METQTKSGTAAAPAPRPLLTNPELIERLNRLCQFDIDAVFAYERAIQGADDADIRRHLEEFRDEHDEHVFNLMSIIHGLGGRPPEVGRDLKGVLLESFTAVRSLTGAIGALKAMLVNERLTNHAYDDAVSWSTFEDLRALLEEHREDERRHLAYIEQILELQEKPLASSDGGVGTESLGSTDTDAGGETMDDDEVHPPMSERH